MLSRLWSLTGPTASGPFATRRDEIKSYVYRVSTGVVVVSFGAWGVVFSIPRLTPHYLVTAFRNLVDLPPISYLPFPVNPVAYSVSIGLFEVGCAALMVTGRDKPLLQSGISCSLLVLMIGAVFSLYEAQESWWTFVTPASLAGILLVRLLSARSCRSIKKG